MKRVYRFRSTERLLRESKELEKQEIYFASPSELNDPTEGFRPVVWRGDSIVWTNLFRHYVYCLHWTCIRFSLSARDSSIREIPIPVMGDLDHVMTPSMRHLNELAFAKSSEKGNLPKLVGALTDSKLSVSEMDMLFFLQLFHFSAIEGIRSAHSEHGHAIPHLLDTPNLHPLKHIPEALELAAQIDHDKASDIVLEISSKLAESSYFGGKFALYRRLQDQQLDIPKKNLKYLYFDFPRAYLKHLTRLLYPNWYAACFSRNCNNAATWASYGNDHKGVCLVFETISDSGSSALTLRRHDPDGGERSPNLELFHDVSYGPDKVEIDFFRSIGRLTLPKAIETWYSDDKGNLSECGAHLRSDSDLWLKKYWDRFLPGIIQKSVDWRHETETRLVINGLLDDLTPAERKATYEFPSLVEIIFGIRTPDRKKMEVIEVIRQKCFQHGREEFKFSQAYYSRKTDRIESYELITYRKSE